MTKHMLETEFSKIIEYLKQEFRTLRAGRASLDLISDILVEAYNTKMPMNQLATLSLPEPRLAIIQPWDKALLKNIEKALRENLADLNPSASNDIIRVPFPAPTEERRRELVKEAGKIAEDAKVKIRRVREEELKKLTQQKEEKEISEDEFFRRKDTLQDHVDTYNKQIGEMLKKKEEDIMTL